MPGCAVDPRVQAFGIAKGAQALNDLQQHPLHQIVHVSLIAHSSGDERPQVAIQFLPRQTPPLID